MKKIVATLVGTAALLVLTAAPAAAQDRQLGVGFTCQDWNSGFCGSKGFQVDIAQRVHKAPTTATSVVFDFGYNVFSGEEKDTSFLGGVRETFMRDQKWSPFVHATIGEMHWSQTFPFTDSGNDLMVGGGGGIKFDINDMIAAKVQYDFWRAHDSTFHKWDSIQRLSLGVVINLDQNK